MIITTAYIFAGAMAILVGVFVYTIKRFSSQQDVNTNDTQNNKNEIALVKMRVAGIEEDNKHFVRMETLQLLLNNIDLRLQNIQQKLNDK